MSATLRTENLSFSYSKQARIHDLSLLIPAGSCFGLLGQNGAGKSTVMKLLLGLLKPQRGKVFLFGKELQEKKDIFKKVGALVEDPPLYPYLSAEDNMKISALYRNISNKRIAKTLAQVGLSSNAKQKVSTFSTGMKQRLGIALTLLHDPQLLILDEPVNGLDPEGIVTIRKLIQHLHHEGKTILLSSHLLHEVELSCDHVGILHQGELLFQGKLKTLRQEQYAAHPVSLEISDLQKGAQTLKHNHYQASIHHDLLDVNLQHKEEISTVIDLLRQQDISIFQIKAKALRLEDLYLHFTQAKTSAHGKI
ncbi:ABC-type multidrug transport system ATPase subunit [Catalinimonas alkaloidigena]|uniref:ABC transporter ATP-binding protein n=1 Tax=Catalinimonas alkaloidigena TaxID=1075417 RepID=UPI0024070826|nr:ATP-binding cassette domain-containing protein [Catalinimonas alkaloidigena]MDF9798677.1 ABC-type multidrug transport system ATPase subunit [Catalinimonas alkaloidigena]